MIWCRHYDWKSVYSDFRFIGRRLSLSFMLVFPSISWIIAEPIKRDLLL